MIRQWLLMMLQPPMKEIPVKIKILANDYDVDGNIEPSSVLITGETGGSFVANNNGEVTFTPSAWILR